MKKAGKEEYTTIRCRKSDRDVLMFITRTRGYKSIAQLISVIVAGYLEAKRGLND